MTFNCIYIKTGGGCSDTFIDRGWGEGGDGSAGLWLNTLHITIYKACSIHTKQTVLLDGYYLGVSGHCEAVAYILFIITSIVSLTLSKCIIKYKR